MFTMSHSHTRRLDAHSLCYCVHFLLLRLSLKVAGRYTVGLGMKGMHRSGLKKLLVNFNPVAQKQSILHLFVLSANSYSIGYLPFIPIRLVKRSDTLGDNNQLPSRPAICCLKVHLDHGFFFQRTFLIGTHSYDTKPSISFFFQSCIHPELYNNAQNPR